jgi:hypothetical protein
MNGNSPSLAETQMKQGIAQAQTQGMQAASGARGIDRAAAFRQAQNNSANLAGQGAIAGGQQRLQEQQLGAQGYAQGSQAQGNIASTTRQQDINEQQGLMGLQNQAQQNLNKQYEINANITSGNAANQQKAAGGLVQAGAAAIGGLAMSDERAKEDIHPTGSYATYAGPDSHAMAQAYAARAPGVTAKEPDVWSNIANGLAGGQSASSGAQAQNGGQMFDSVTLGNIKSAFSGGASEGDSGGGSDMMAGMAGGMMGGMMSDERSKEALHNVHPYQFEYKDEPAHQIAQEAAGKAYAQAFADAKQPRVGVMAQDLASTPEGSQTVMSTPQGLQIQGKRALGFMLANQADFNDRISALEHGRRV